MRTILVAVSLLLVGAPVRKHETPASKNGNLVVGLCDGETSQEVEGVKPGETLSPERAQKVSDELMSEWKKKHPDARWDEEALLAQVQPAPGGSAKDPAAQRAAGQRENAPADQGKEGAPVGVGHTYGAFGERDFKIWEASTKAAIDRGDKIFHDAKAVGGTIGVSCDMCHPNAANTHPETYPKYQVQLGRVALLRDMINWCIENPVRGKPLADDDDRLKALEAFILAQRKGVPLEYGKH